MSIKLTIKDVSCIGEYHILDGSSEKVSNEMSTMGNIGWAPQSDMSVLVKPDGTVNYTIVMFRPTPECVRCHVYHYPYKMCGEGVAVYDLKY